jgi:glycine cleavage system regulatory protein
LTLALSAGARPDDIRAEGGLLLAPVDSDISIDAGSVVAINYGGIRLVLIPSQSGVHVEGAPRLENGAQEHLQADSSLSVATFHFKDRRGALFHLTEHFRRLGANVVAATESSVGPNATVALSIELPADAKADALGPIPELEEVIRDRSLTDISKLEKPAPSKKGSFWNISISGPDRIGLMWTVMAAISHHGGLVRRCSAATRPDGPANERFSIVTIVELHSEANVQFLRNSLVALFPEDYAVRIASAPSLLDYWFDVPEPSRVVGESTIVALRGSVTSRRFEDVTRLLFEEDFNVVGASVTTLGDYFIAVVSLSDFDPRGGSGSERIQAAVERFNRWNEMEARWFPASDDGLPVTGPTRRYDFRVTALDRLGVLSSALAAVDQCGGSMENVYLHIDSRVVPSVAVIRMRVDVPQATDAGQLESDEIHRTLDEKELLEGWLSYTLVPDDPPDWFSARKRQYVGLSRA